MSDFDKIGIISDYCLDFNCDLDMAACSHVGS